MPTERINGLDLHFQIDGEGPETVVLINGLADELETWSYQVAALLPAGYRVVRFDNRGIGQSAKPPGPYSSGLLATDTKALVDHLGVRDFHLMGVSMGGMIALARCATSTSPSRPTWPNWR
jgi:3-oxoadipate enol-lactonase